MDHRHGSALAEETQMKRLDFKVIQIGYGWYWIGRNGKRSRSFTTEHGAQTDYFSTATRLGSRFDLPKRRRSESPVQYYTRTGAVDDNFTRRWRGWYYCNSAHCKHRWRSKAERDEHLDMAYAALS